MIRFMKIKMSNRLAKIAPHYSRNVFISVVKIRWLHAANQIYSTSPIIIMKILNLLVYKQHKKLINLCNFSAIIQAIGIF